METKKVRMIIVALLIVTISYLCTHLFSITEIYDKINSTLYDTLFRITVKGDKKTDSAGIIAINDFDLNYMEEKYQYTWPWPRSVYGLISNYLIQNGAKAVVFDIVFSNPDFDREKLGMTGFASDGYFKSIIHKTNKVVVPLNIDNTYESKVLPDPLSEDTLMSIFRDATEEEQKLIQEAYQFDDYTGYFAVKQSFYNEDVDKKTKVYHLITQSSKFYLPSEALTKFNKPLLKQYKYLRFPYSLYAENNKNMGFVENLTDSDGVIRRYETLVKVGDRVVPSLALAAYMVSENQLPSVKNITQNGTFDIKWYGKGGVHTDIEGIEKNTSTYKYFAAHYVFDSAREQIIMGREPVIPKENIEGKVFFIGNISRALLDQKNTPFSVGQSIYPGVEIHATAFVNLLFGDRMKSMNPIIELILIFLFPILLISITGVKTQSIKVHISFVVVVTIFMFLVQFILFYYFDIISNSVYFLLLVIFSLVITLATNYMIVGRNRNLIKSALGMYISPALEKEITASGKPLAITGESVTASAMFVDIAGFTTFSEKNTASKVVEVLNVYLNWFSEYIMDNSGFVNKFLGDGLMALFGTITPLDNHVDLALDSAIACLAKTEALADTYGLDIRIGINSGEMIKGNMGGSKRLEFTAIGDNVNLASRLEGANKFFGTKIIIGENSFDNLKDSKFNDSIIFLGKFCVKGKDIPIRFYAYMNMEAKEKEMYSNFLDSYYNKDLEAFEKMKEYYKGKMFKPADIYIEHCQNNPEEFGLPIKFTEK